MGTLITPELVDVFEEEVDFKSGISERTWFKIGSVINWLTRNAADKIGDIKMSNLTPADFFSSRASFQWVLMDGQDVTGSGYHTLTGNGTVPDMRGRFPRMQDNGAGIDPGRNLGTNQAESINPATTLLNHTHAQTLKDDNGAIEDMLTIRSAGGSDINGVSLGARTTALFNNAEKNATDETPTWTNPGSETRPVNTSLNFFIKINN